MLNVMNVIILGILQLDEEEEGFKTIMKDHHIPGTLMDIALLAICMVIRLLIATKGI